MKSANGSAIDLLGVCERVPVHVGSFEYAVPFFVVDTPSSHPLVFGRPFEFQLVMFCPSCSVEMS